MKKKVISILIIFGIALAITLLISKTNPTLRKVTVF